MTDRQKGENVFYNQNDYPDVPYPYKNDIHNTIASAGCGLCACCMVVEALTGASFTPPEAAEMALRCGARVAFGTDMSTMAPAVCAKFGLQYALTDDCGRVLQFLQQKKGMAVANPGGDRDGWTGVYTDTCHYVVIAAAEGMHVKVWDPMLMPGRYDVPGRKGKVTVDGNDTYTDINTIARDCENRTPAYTLFWREGDASWK